MSAVTKYIERVQDLIDMDDVLRVEEDSSDVQFYTDAEPMLLSLEESDPESAIDSTVGSDGDVYVPAEVNDSADMQALIDASVEAALAADGGNAAQEAQLAEIAEQLSLITTPSLPSLTSSQMQYFEGVLAKNPFMDYSAIMNDSNDYSLYYGYNLSPGDNVDYIRIYRTNQSGYNYVYAVEKGETTLPDISSAEAVVSTYLPGCAVFSNVEVVKHETFFSLGLCVALGLCVLRSILFR